MPSQYLTNKQECKLKDFFALFPPHAKTQNGSEYTFALLFVGLDQTKVSGG